MFQQRQTEMISARKIAGRHFKIYTIIAADKPLQSETVKAAIEHVGTEIPWPNTDSGFGFITIHFGDSIWLLVDLWKDDILCHHVFRSDYDNPTIFLPGPQDGTMACVWEMEVISHERNAWVRHVMAKVDNPDYKQYSSDCLSIDASENQNQNPFLLDQKDWQT